MISQTAEYALRAAVCLADAAGEARTTHSISKCTGVSASYLSKILRSLTRRGIVSSRRGPRGGFLLTRSPAQITALDVIHAVDPPLVLDRCPLGLTGHRGRLCALHAKLARTYAMIESTLRESTLLELVENNAPGQPGCGFPAAAIADKEEDR